MIIVNQDRELMINFDKIVRTYIESNDNGKFEIIAETDGLEESLGEYETQERAREVLEEIQSRYLQYHERNGKVIVLPKRYRMPEK